MKLLKWYSMCVLFFLSLNLFAQTSFKLEELTIKDLHHAIQTKQITCEQIVNAYIFRIKQYNLSTQTKAPINAIVEINSSVIEQARQLDNLFRQTHELTGSLHCVPIVLKDNIDSFDLTTTSGSYALLGNQPIKDAFLTAQLRKAGAIILAKGGMDEFAWGFFGMSSRNGRIGNVYDTKENSGGSSGGSAAAVSANFTLLGIGTDNSGSVRIPAVFNGIYGLRPSTGLISQQGIFPMGNLDGTAGPLARTVSDLAILLEVIAKSDPADKKTLSIPRPKTYIAYLNNNGLEGKRIGVVHWVGKINTMLNTPAEIKTKLYDALNIMRKAGANIIENINLTHFENDRELNQAGEIEDVNHYLDSYPAARTDFRDICLSDRTRNFGTVKECLAFIDDIQSQSLHKKEVIGMFERNQHYIESVMDKYHLDALLILISTHGIPTYEPTYVNTWRAPVSSNAGLPSIAMPIGYTNNLPIGIELIARKYAEPTLIEIAYSYEKHSNGRKLPPMPEINHALVNLSIPQFNHLINVLGQQTYLKYLQKDKKEELTADIFRKFSLREINDYIASQK